MTEQRLRGQMDRLEGKIACYGCHFGMRSTLEADKAEYFAGWREIDYALRYGEEEPKR